MLPWAERFWQYDILVRAMNRIFNEEAELPLRVRAGEDRRQDHVAEVASGPGGGIRVQTNEPRSTFVPLIGWTQ